MSLRRLGFFVLALHLMLATGCRGPSTVAEQSGNSVVKDAGKGAALDQQACSDGNMAGCNNLGVLYKNGKGVVKDASKAAEQYQQACSGGAMEGCYNLGVVYENGNGVVKDARKAAELYQQACSGGIAQACSE